ncbi:hypothetical protein RQM47_14985 [Rubrivirga sp. S365]|uniref:Uncharacterized protein n=1 Tax=Rubrivirga litoralis TaxID=3075598 RepID=A0ABU3BRU2_9BACT|nr:MULTISPECIES: hypothetical protein [unclassified Rubrivirga]MDT0631896.1 hypothetical protein [Rubrivirga sp. F394]MDT7857949.1 hypothetical protein [Rubrivirga sp. S365]
MSAAPPARTDTPAPPGAVVLDFDPARDGFSFPNRFEWTDGDLDVLAGALRPLAALPFALGGALGGRFGGGSDQGGAGTAAGAAVAGGAGWAVGGGLVRSVARRWPTFGLCGGMALAAVERWPARGRVATAALEREPMRALLRRRQEATLRASLPRFARYWALVRFTPGAMPHAPLAGALAAELDRVEAALRAGRPALLGLVGDAPDPFTLHQVVAFGVDRRGRLDATLQVYDPNAPGQTRTITTGGAGAGRTAISTDLPTGRRADGRVHISTRPGHLSHLFVIDPDA